MMLMTQTGLEELRCATRVALAGIINPHLAVTLYACCAELHEQELADVSLSFIMRHVDAVAKSEPIGPSVSTAVLEYISHSVAFAS